MNSIILIGMPCAGKSTVGVILAKTLGMTFVDTDIAIQERACRSRRTLSIRRGRIAFLLAEEETIMSLSLPQLCHRHRGQCCFFAKSDGPVERRALSCTLEISCGEMARRLKNITTRGIVLFAGQGLCDMHRQSPAVPRPMPISRLIAKMRTSRRSWGR